MPRVVSVYARPSVWSPTSLCAAATAPPTTASASCTCGPAKNRWTSAWSARENAVSEAGLPAARVRVTVMFRPCVLIGWGEKTQLNPCREPITKGRRVLQSWKFLLQQGVNCIAIRKGLLTLPLIPFQKCVSWRVNLPKHPPSIAAFFRKWPFQALTCCCALCLMQKHVAALFVPGVPDVSGTSASAHSAQERPSQSSAAATVPPTTASATSAGRPACRRGESTWSSMAAAMKVGNGPGDCVIMFNQLATEAV